MSADAIVSQYPSLTLAEVYAALSYYFDNVAEIQQQMLDDQAFVQQGRQNNPSLLAAN